MTTLNSLLKLTWDSFTKVLQFVNWGLNDTQKEYFQTEQVPDNGLSMQKQTLKLKNHNSDKSDTIFYGKRSGFRYGEMSAPSG